MEEIIEEQDSTTPVEPTLEELGKTILQQEEEIANLPADQQEFHKAMLKTNKQLYERAKKNVDNKQDRGTPKPAAPPEVKLTELSTTEVLKLRADGYDDREILQLQEEASRLKVSVTTLTENPTFKKGFEALRKENKVNASTPSTSSRSAGFAFKGKPYGELKTDAERREAFNARRSGNNGSSE